MFIFVPIKSLERFPKSKSELFELLRDHNSAQQSFCVMFREDPEAGPTVAGLSKVTVDGVDTIFALLQVCHANSVYCSCQVVHRAVIKLHECTLYNHSPFCRAAMLVLHDVATMSCTAQHCLYTFCTNGLLLFYWQSL